MKEKKLIILEWKILRNIYGPVKSEETGEWRIITNNDLYIDYILSRVDNFSGQVTWCSRLSEVGIHFYMC